MGMIDKVFGILFGQRNVVAETAAVFRENAEGAAVRRAALSAAALAQFSAEFQQPKTGGFDRFMDGLNRIPRPALALGTLGLFVAAMVEPVWFASRMTGLALIPEPLWWLLGAIVSFYFGARHQVKGQEFQASIAAALARAPQVAEGLAALTPPSKPEPKDEPAASSPASRESGTPVENAPIRAANAAAHSTSGNAALDEWRAQHG